MKLKITIFFILIIGKLSSQSITTDFHFCIEDQFDLNVNYLSRNVAIHSNCYSLLIKSDATKESFGNELYFTKSLFNLLVSGKLKSYKLNDNSIIPTNQVKSYFETIDTISTFDPYTYEPTVKYQRNINLESIKGFRIKQSWMITENGFKVDIIGIIPIQEVNGKIKELLFIENEQLPIDSLLNNFNISWIKSNEDHIFIPEILKTNKIFKEVIWNQPKQKTATVYKYDFNMFHDNDVF